LIPSFHYYCRGKYALRSIFAMNTASCIWNVNLKYISMK
jgi:hypothetical protein